MRLADRLAAAQRGKRAPRGAAAIRTQRILGLSNLTQGPVGLLLTAERAIRMTLRPGAGGANARTVEHAYTA